MKGVVGSWCFCLFQLGLKRRSRWFRGRLYAIKGRSGKAQSLQHIFNLYIHSHIQFTISRELPPLVKKSLIEASLRASSPIWASEASRERTRERAAKPRGTEERRNLLSPPPLPAFVSPLACLSRVYFSRYPPN